MILRPFGALYGLAMSVRNRLFDRGILEQQRCGLPVVSIGNITAGGSGKTPLAIATAAILAAAGRRPVFLSRGYGGSEPGPHHVQPDDTSDRVGDEPVLLARRGIAPVVIARSRVEGAQFIKQHSLGDCIVLDDGFQHRHLARNADIVAIDIGSHLSARQFLNGRVLPAGRLREHVGPALRRATAVVLSRRGLSLGADPLDVQRIRALVPPETPIFEADISAWTIQDAATGAALVAPAEICACCGIANPEAFFATLEHLGFSVLESKALPDHSPRIGRQIAAFAARYPGLPIVVTEKDLSRLTRPYPEKLTVLRIETEVRPREDFERYLMRALLAPEGNAAYSGAKESA